MKVNVTKITCLFSLCLCDFFYLYCLRKLFLKLEQILQLRHRFVDSLIKTNLCKIIWNRYQNDFQ